MAERENGEKRAKRGAAQLQRETIKPGSSARVLVNDRSVFLKIGTLASDRLDPLQNIYLSSTNPEVQHERLNVRSSKSCGGSSLPPSGWEEITTITVFCFLKRKRKEKNREKKNIKHESKKFKSLIICVSSRDSSSM